MGNHSKCFRCGMLDEDCACHRQPAASQPAQGVGLTDELREALSDAKTGHGSYGPNYDGNKLAASISAILARQTAPVQQDAVVGDPYLYGGARKPWSAPTVGSVPLADDGAFQSALDAAYPIPDSPHTSVVRRAVDARIAFRFGWEARDKIVAPQDQATAFAHVSRGTEEAQLASIDISNAPQEQAASRADLLAEARAVFDLMLDGCPQGKFGDYENGYGETIGPRMDALHAKLRALSDDAVSASRAAVPEGVMDVGRRMAAWLYGLSQSALPYQSWKNKCKALSDEWDLLAAAPSPQEGKAVEGGRPMQILSDEQVFQLRAIGTALPKEARAALDDWLLGVQAPRAAAAFAAQQTSAQVDKEGGAA